MGDPKAFLNIPRQEAGYRPVNERIADYSQVEQTLNTNSRKLQASRCMDCGVPFCHWACPIGNKQPEWQDALYRGKWKEAYEVLSSTCDFPEFTGCFFLFFFDLRYFPCFAHFLLESFQFFYKTARCHSIFIFKCPMKIRQIVKAYRQGDFQNRCIALLK